MRVLRPASFRRVPWKNGGGVTSEILVEPKHASTDSFDVRVSAATVAADGPFSIFPGVDRTLVVTSGAGMTLSRRGAESVALDPTSAPFFFAGDDAWSAALQGGPVEDFNVMTRRDRAFHAVFRLDFDATTTFASKHDLTLVALISGVASVESAPTPLERGSVLVIERDEPPITLRANGVACVLRVEIDLFSRKIS